MLTSSCSPAYGVDVNPNERNILFYTLQVIPQGIELHFVFDGGKRLSNGGKLHPGFHAPSELFRDTLTKIGIPWHEAPAEAEAECAKMEMEGFVDGVWSEDGDALAFGCKTLIRFQPKVVSSTENGEDKRKSKTQFKVYKLWDIAIQNPGMSQDGFILHAVLNGQPKDVGELYTLGPQDVLKAAELGLGKSLCAAATTQENLREWATRDFAGYLSETRKKLEIPADFPKWEHVQDYLDPVVSTSVVLSNRSIPPDPFLDEQALFSFLIKNFQWTKTQWVKYILPFRIVRSLLATKTGQASQHDCLKLECDLPKKQTPKKNQSPQKHQSPKTAKATFLICKATSLDTTELGTKERSRGTFETLLWILRKANFNGQPPMTAYLLSPDSAQKGKGVASASVSGPFRVNRQPLTPSSVSPSSSNEDDLSERNERLRRSQNPTLSPTPTSRKRKRTLPLSMGTNVSKNIPKVSKGSQDYGSSREQRTVSGKGKDKEIQRSPKMRESAKRTRSPSNPSHSSSDDLYDDPDKRPRPGMALPQRPSTPPGRITEPADALNNVIIIDSDSDDDMFGNLVPAAQLSSTLPPRDIVDTGDDIIVIDSEDGENESEFGSFPSDSQLAAAFGDTSVQAIPDSGLVDESPSDEYGSPLASPDLLALVD